ncbi:MAG: hypothetical protein ACRCZW_10620 [Lactobacillaceae bacterium]
MGISEEWHQNENGHKKLTINVLAKDEEVTKYNKNINLCFVSM